MVASVLLALTLCASEIQPLNDPVSYVTATITTADGAEYASLLAVHESAVDATSLASDKKPLWSDLVARVSSQYPTVDRRQRARMTAEMLQLQDVGVARSDHSVWLRFPGGSVTRAERVSYPESGDIWRLYDGGTGQYMAIVRSGDASSLTALIAEMFKHGADPEAAGRFQEEAKRMAAQIEAMIEVNGQRQYLAKGTATPGALGAETVALFPNLYGEGRQRLLQSLALLEAIHQGSIKVEDPNLMTIGHVCSAPCDPAALGLPTLPKTLLLKVTAKRSAFLEPPEETVVTPFFGDKGWPQPDLDREFKEQVRKLLSASD